MKLAVSTDNGRVAAHFGRCPQYTLVTVGDDGVAEPEVIANPGHQPGFLPGYLAERQVNVIIAGGMGPRAQSLFHNLGIETVVGAQGPVDDVVSTFLAGTLTTGESLCEHEQEAAGPCH